MSANKKRRTNGPETDPDFGLAKAFPIDLLPNVDLETQAQDARTYLSQVRLQALSTPSVYRVIKDTQPPKETQEKPLCKPKLPTCIPKYKTLKTLYNKPATPPEEVPTTFTGWHSYVSNNEPAPSLYTDSTLVKLASYLTKWLKKPTPRFIEWSQAILCTLPSDLSADDMWIVRCLGQKLLQVTKDDTRDFIGGVLGEVFHQWDLCWFEIAHNVEIEY